MELKRYVLKENGIIFDRQIASFYISDIKRTSDNILDLVDSMDLVVCKINNEFIKNEFAYMVIANPLFLSDLVFFLANGDKVWFRDNQYDDDKKYADIKRNGIEIKAIYKRQTNGDYKRYEVEN